MNDTVSLNTLIAGLGIVILVNLIILGIVLNAGNLENRLDKLEEADEVNPFLLTITDENTGESQTINIGIRTLDLTVAVNSHEERLQVIESLIIQAQQQGAQ